MDFTSAKFPYRTEFFEDEQKEEGHQEPAGELVHSNVVDYEHPFLSVTQLKHTLNFNRIFGNSDEETLSDDIDPKVLTDIVKAAYKNKFPLEALIYALDVKEKMDTRSSASDATGIINEFRSYVPQLKETLGRAPLNSEVFMAYMLQSASQVKTLLDKAKEKPYEYSTPVGSQYDQIIFYKKRIDQTVIRKNKEVVQYFSKRMVTGANVFPHSPFDTANQNA